MSTSAANLAQKKQIKKIRIKIKTTLNNNQEIK